MKREAFTLIEILVVLLLVVLIISMIAPKGNKLYDSILNKIDEKETLIQNKEKSFESFLIEESIKTEDIKTNRYGIIINDTE